MAIRIIIIIIALLMASTAFAMDPIYIGGGRDGPVINLDQGARNERISYYFGSSGFAAPRSPQPMSVDPGAMVYQSEKYMDATEDLYIKTSEILNMTAILARDVEENRERVDQSARTVAELQRSAKASADDSRASAGNSMAMASKAKDYLDETASLCNQTLATARKMDALALKMSEMEKSTRANAEQSSEDAKLAGSYLNETESVHYELTGLISEAKTLDMKIAWLRSAIASYNSSLPGQISAVPI